MYTNNDGLLSITKGLKVCHAHNMKKKIQRDLSSYLKYPEKIFLHT